MFKSTRKRVGQASADVAAIEARPAPETADRRELLNRISDFLLDHELAVNPGNLALAQEVVSGRNPELGRRIASRQLAKEPITQDWLDGLKIDTAQGGAQDSAFAHVLEIEADAARAAGEPLSIALCNIDRFTAINDSHGRDTGDRVIQAVARVLQRVSDHNCHVARDGSDDFAVLFRGLTPEQAADQLNRTREKFAQRKLIDSKTHLAIGSVTFSGGVTDVMAYDDSPAALRLANEALKAAKEQGRNRVVVARSG